VLLPFDAKWPSAISLNPKSSASVVVLVHASEPSRHFVPYYQQPLRGSADEQSRDLLNGDIILSKPRRLRLRRWCLERRKWRRVSIPMRGSNFLFPSLVLRCRDLNFGAPIAQSIGEIALHAAFDLWQNIPQNGVRAWGFAIAGVTHDANPEMWWLIPPRCCPRPSRITYQC
jgi:hypothetical protein